MDPKKTLVNLTRDVIQVLMSRPGEEIELSEVEQKLEASKRRLYDVVNVLAGAGFIERCGKARVRWIGSEATYDEDTALRVAIDQEKALDILTTSVDTSLQELAQSDSFKSLAWITEEDVLDLITDETLSVFALHGPPDMQITIPANENNAEQTIICNSQTGAIDFVMMHVATK